MNVIEEIKIVVDKLDHIDNYCNELNVRLSEVDGKVQDLLHYIENNKINMLWCYRMVKKLKELQVERRKIKNDMEISRRYYELIQRILNKDNRKSIVTELYKRDNQLQKEYKNRQYTVDDIDVILKGDNHEC